MRWAKPSQVNVAEAVLMSRAPVMDWLVWLVKTAVRDSKATASLCTPPATIAFSRIDVFHGRSPDARACKTGDALTNRIVRKGLSRFERGKANVELSSTGLRSTASVPVDPTDERLNERVPGHRRVLEGKRKQPARGQSVGTRDGHSTHGTSLTRFLCVRDRLCCVPRPHVKRRDEDMSRETPPRQGDFI